MFPTTCVTFSHTSLPADPKMCFRLISRECSAWVRAACPEAIKASLQGECWDTHTPRDTAMANWEHWEHWEQVLHAPLVPSSRYGITRPGHQGLIPSKPFKSCCVLGSKLQLTEGDSPPQGSLCGNRGKTLLWDKSAVCEPMGKISRSFFLG